MKTKDFELIAQSFFPNETLEFFNDGTQFGFNNMVDKEIKKIGYSVNLTMDIINQAKDASVDLILTHHNVWEDHFEMREDCLKALRENQLIHYFNHLPLDSMPFGPTGSFAQALGVKPIEKISSFEGFYFGIVGEFKSPISLTQLKEKVEKVLDHKVRIWKHHDRLIKRVGIVSGSGKDLESLHDAVSLQCDAYITGEKKLSALLYSKHMGLNYILGSHTFTELGGMKTYVNLIKDKMDETEFIQLNDEFIE